MKTFLVTTAAAASLLFIAPIARGQAPTEQNAPVVTTKINLTLEQRHVIKEIVKDLKIENAPLDINLAVGDTVSKSVHLQPMPPEVAAKVSQVKSHLFLVKGSQVVIVEQPSCHCRSEGQQDRRCN
jgi:hypothetical protein